MRILILGGDGYLGWPMAMHFAKRGHDVTVVDNYLRRKIAMGNGLEALIQGPNLHERAQIFEAEFNRTIDVRIGDCAICTSCARWLRRLPRKRSFTLQNSYLLRIQ